MNLIELKRALGQLRLGGIAAVLETRLLQAQQRFQRVESQFLEFGDKQQLFRVHVHCRFYGLFQIDDPANQPRTFLMVAASSSASR